MLQSITEQSTTQNTLITSTLARLRQEWQEATEGNSLLETDGNIGLLLADLINGFRLNTDRQIQILGNSLFLELKELLYCPRQN